LPVYLHNFVARVTFLGICRSSRPRIDFLCIGWWWYCIYGVDVSTDCLPSENNVGGSSKNQGRYCEMFMVMS